MLVKKFMKKPKWKPKLKPKIKKKSISPFKAKRKSALVKALLKPKYLKQKKKSVTKFF